MATTESSNTKEGERPQVSFSHVQLYVDHLEDLSAYKELEDRLNDLEGGSNQQHDLWNLSSAQPQDPQSVAKFFPQNRDLVKQLLAGFGFRVTGVRQGNSNTRSVLVTSKDLAGVQFLLTAKHSDNENNCVGVEEFHHFDATNVDRFYKAHGNRQGIAVLAFMVENINLIRERYQARHPKLVAGCWEYNGVRILEVFAYYQKETHEADEGTTLRFVEVVNRDDNSAMACPLPGLEGVEAAFPSNCQAAYCDHWVSNVFKREEFLDTLHDTLDFTPKVDFNAGVVAAGEAQIESTVTGNDLPVLGLSKEEALRDQHQVYLPINNALSSVGHVHGFLEELGQGVQHIASRVDDLVEFVQRANDARKITGEGFTFLNIPRSYYGVLTAKQLALNLPALKSNVSNKAEAIVSMDCAHAVVDVLEKRGILSKDGAVDLDASREDIHDILVREMNGSLLKEYLFNSRGILDRVLFSRYQNLYSLLRNHVNEETYLGIVRNKILVDVQGDDLLYQIFTSNILQRNVGEEAPFLEFIQRVCSVCTDENGCAQKVKPGCGGFGIRNFLTLFLSIEVSKAMQDVCEAKHAGDKDGQAYAEQMVECFTKQLNEANPILTGISDAMTEEGHCKEQVDNAETEDEVAIWKAKMEDAAQHKKDGNVKLMECSARYNSIMKALREARAQRLAGGRSIKE